MYRVVAFCSATQSQMLSELRLMSKLLYRSAVLHDRGTALTILTDNVTDLTDFPQTLVSRHDVDRENVMLARTSAQAEFVSQYDFAQPLAFLDLDILINRPIGWLFEKPFDIALTSRRKADMPINGGVILANNLAPANVRTFFSSLLATYRSRHADQAAWWGDQRALNDLVPLSKELIEREVHFEREGVRYLMLPGSAYNFSPHALWATLALPRRNKYILHFKSASRKKYFKRYFDLHYEHHH